MVLKQKLIKLCYTRIFFRKHDTNEDIQSCFSPCITQTFLFLSIIRRVIHTSEYNMEMQQTWNLQNMLSCKPR